MLLILYSSGSPFATKMDIKRPFEIRIVAKFSIFYGRYGQNYAFFCRDVRLRSTHLLTFLQKKSAHNFIKTRGGWATVVCKIYKKNNVLLQVSVSKLSLQIAALYWSLKLDLSKINLISDSRKLFFSLHVGLVQYQVRSND